MEKSIFIFKIHKKIKPSFFGFPILNKDIQAENNLLKMLAKKGVETRPIISGNFLRQPHKTLQIR